MSTYGGLVMEIPIKPTPIAAQSGLVRGTLIEINAGLAVAWGGANPIYGVSISDVDNDQNLINVYTSKGGSFQLLCATGIVPTPGALLYFSSGGGVQLTGTAGTAVAKAVGPGMNGMVEAVFI